MFSCGRPLWVVLAGMSMLWCCPSIIYFYFSAEHELLEHLDNELSDVEVLDFLHCSWRWICWAARCSSTHGRQASLELCGPRSHLVQLGLSSLRLESCLPLLQLFYHVCFWGCSYWRLRAFFLDALVRSVIHTDDWRGSRGGGAGGHSRGKLLLDPVSEGRIIQFGVEVPLIVGLGLGHRVTAIQEAAFLAAAV